MASAHKNPLTTVMLSVIELKNAAGNSARTDLGLGVIIVEISIFFLLL